MARIFLCHASEDKAQVREVYQRLKALGFEPWLDEEDILPGQDWEYEIERALETSDFVIVFLSTRSVGKVGYVQREFRRALYKAEEMPEGFIHTIPVKLDDCEVPHRFSHHQWANLYQAGAFDRIVRALYHGLQQRGQPLPESSTHDPSSARPEPAPPPNRRVRPRKRSSKRPAMTAIALRTFTNSIGMEFVLIPAGTFMMGSPDSDTEALDNEKPAHQVTISQPFYLGKCQVTRVQWEAVMGNTPIRPWGVYAAINEGAYLKGNVNEPVENEPLENVLAFIDRLNAREGHTLYRLPTEAEWEYACRAGSTTAYCFGDDSRRLEEYAWYSGSQPGGPYKANQVGTRKPNAWGLYDMHGNVWEWVQDWYGEYVAGPVTDPRGPASGPYHVFRGGGWGDIARRCRSASRGLNQSGFHYIPTGFRLLRTAP